MKLATYADGSRDGQLVVVSRDLSLAHYAGGLATRLQQVLDDWNFLSPQLEDLSATLNGGKARHAFAFDPARCLAPLPRAYQWALAPDATGTTGAAPLQRASDDLLGPGAPAWLPRAQPGAVLHAGVAVVTGDIPRGASRAQALERVRLVLLAHAWSLTAGAAPPAGVFAPLAVTPDELGQAWRDGQMHLPVCTTVHARHAEVGPGPCPPGTPATKGAKGAQGTKGEDLGDLLAALARLRNVRAGSIVGPRGIAPSEAPAGNWQDGDLVHSEVTGPDGISLFGAIDQRIALADAADEVEGAA